MNYSIGLSIGQLSDRSAASVVRVTDDEIMECVHLQTWQPGTPHLTLIADLRTMLDAPALRDDDAAVTLAIDVTLAGITVGRMYRERLDVYTVYYDITPNAAEGALSKREIVSMVRVLLEERRLRYGAALEHTAALQVELQQFQIKQVTSDHPLADWRTRPHDDLVIATALACWTLQHTSARLFFWG